jgi:hypothetical protein
MLRSILADAFPAQRAGVETGAGKIRLSSARSIAAAIASRRAAPHAREQANVAAVASAIVNRAFMRSLPRFQTISKILGRRNVPSDIAFATSRDILR